jgi:CRISPR system Cascade subunit CasD
VGQERPSDAHPSKSAILGLLAAAMGVRREEEERHVLLAATYGFAVRVEAPGLLLRDYHTTQAPPERRKVVHYTRRDELRADDLNTILSSREYRCDALYTVALWVINRESLPFTLDELAEGLRQPRFVLYLGRKSCPLALPVQAVVITAPNLEAAFAQIDFKDAEDVGRLQQKRILLCWEPGAEVGAWQPLQTVTRRDHPLSRRRWQFSERSEHQAPASLAGKE